MSFVGTRPEVPKYVSRYTDEMLATLLLPAGITKTFYPLFLFDICYFVSFSGDYISICKAVICLSTDKAA